MSSKTEKIHSIRYNFIMNFILTASQFIFPLITFPYVSRVLQAAANGKVSFAASVANYFLMVASLGIPTYGVRACAKVRDDKKKLTKTVHELFFINGITTVCVIITYIVCVVNIEKFRAEQTLFVINGINIVLNMFGMNWLYQALEQYRYITVRSLVFKIVSVVLMFMMVHRPEDYIIYGAIVVFSAVGSNIFNFVRAARIIDFRWIGDYHFMPHMKPIMILFAQSLAVSIYTNLDTVMLGFMKDDQAVGYYNAAVRIKGLLLSLVTSLGNVLLPRMSYYAEHKMKQAFLETMAKALNFTLFLSLPLCIYIAIYSSDMMLFLAGPGYMGAVLGMQIITISVIPNGLTGVLGVQVLTALEEEKYVLKSVIVGAVVDFALNLVLIPKYSVGGAALATTIAEFAVLLVQIVYTRSYLLKVYKEFRGHIYLILSCVGGIAAYMVKYLEMTSTLLNLCLSGTVFFVIYGLGLIFFKEGFVLEALEMVKIKLKMDRK